jgi:integrase/recombinase XerD
MSVVAGFYRTCVIDGVLEHSPADYVRRPNVPPESPTLGLTHLQLKALLTAARDSATQLTSLGCTYSGSSVCGSSRPPGPTSKTWAKSSGTGCCGPRQCGKWPSSRCRQRSPRVADRAIDGRHHRPLLSSRRGDRMDRHAATRRLRQLRLAAGVRMPKIHPHMLRHTFVISPASMA